jgi:hypothetical protein
MRYSRNQVEEAIFRTLGAQDARVDELKFRLKRLLVTDRRLGRDANSELENLLMKARQDTARFCCGI